MQLNAPGPLPSLRNRLGAAACVLLTAGIPGVARAQTSLDPGWQLDGSGLFYGEKGRAIVAEPVARLTRLFSNGQTLFGQVTLDAMTGASPSGGIVSSSVQTTTSASGSVHTSTVGQVPTKPFHDFRGAGDLGWTLPVGTLLSVTTSGHYSLERDYRSVGANVQASLDILRRLVTVTAAGGIYRDGVFPVGGTPIGLSDGTVRLAGTNDKNVTSGAVGLSHVLTRRWLIGVDATRIRENGYLTEPYKILSVVRPDSLTEVSQVTENRPRERERTSVQGNSVYHLEQDVLYANYRYYWDDWGVRSHTVDVRYRHDIDPHTFWQPHIRLYAQTAADFFHFYLVQGDPLPEFASSDFRIGALRSVTLGLTYGFQLPDHPGQFTVRGEYIHQWGESPSLPAPGGGGEFEDGSSPQSVSLFPPLDIGTLHVGYTVQF